MPVFVSFKYYDGAPNMIDTHLWAIVAINLVDFFIVRRGHYSIREIFNPDGIYGRWSWRGLSAYAIGFANWNTARWAPGLPAVAHPLGAP